MAQKKARSRNILKAKRGGRGEGEMERYEKALEGLERALRSLYKGETDKAKEQLEKLRETHADEAGLMDRIQTLLSVCERRMAPPKKPKNTEEMITYGVILHNDGDSQQAIRILSKALEADPDNAHIEYCLAAAHAKIGDGAATAKHLRQAIQADPLSRIHARMDEDFAPVRHQSEISALLAGS